MKIGEIVNLFKAEPFHIRSESNNFLNHGSISPAEQTLK